MERRDCKATKCQNILFQLQEEGGENHHASNVDGYDGIEKLGDIQINSGLVDQILRSWSVQLIRLADLSS